MEELKAIIEKFAESGWDLISAPAKKWLSGDYDGAELSDELVAAIKQADAECGSCGCDFDPLYKRALELLREDDVDIEIKRLTPELMPDYIRFFDDFPGETPEERSCYCSSWCAEDHREGADCLSSPEKRRASAMEYISRGTLQGYLAYADGKAVGWCNANTKLDCVNSFFWIYLMKDVPVSDGEKVKSVYCFTVDPAYRGRGIAEKLLERVCEDAEKDGFDVVEGYPNTMLSNVSFMGPRRLYDKLGFEVFAEVNNMSVMRKSLR